MSDIITLQQAKLYLKVSDSVEDLLIQTLINASIKVCENYINAEIINIASTSGGIEIDDTLRSAIYLQLGSLYENREDYDNSIYNRATILLLDPYRIIYT